MYRIIRDNQKKLMAFFAVGLMVAFLVPTGLQQINDRTDQPRAQMSSGPITYGEFERAHGDWDILRSNVHTYSSFGGPPVPLLLSLGNPSPQRLAILSGQVPAYQFPNAPLAPAEIVGNPQTFLLLWKEAVAAGIIISDQRLDEALATQIIAQKGGTPAADRRIREAIRDFMMVEASYNRIAGQAKTSAPMLERAMVNHFVRLSADVAIFDGAGSMATSMPATGATTEPAAATGPSAVSGILSPDAIQAQFKKYADTPPNLPTEANPFGFGYRIPDRVKVQTLAITHDQLKSVVEKTRTADKWDVAARTYFYTHLSEFPSTQPTSLPSLNAGFDMSAMPTSQPGERKFDDLSAEQKKDALEKAMEPEIDALAGRIVAALNDQFATDFAAAKPSTQPATTGPTDGFTSYHYLEQAAADIQKRFKILPTVEDHAQWVDQNNAPAMPGIGQATTSDGTSFTALAMGARPLHVGHEDDTGLRLYEFSRPLRDFNENLYLFRVTDAQMSHMPATVDEVLPQVLMDVQKQRAADAATTQAKALVDAAAKTGFHDAAGAAGKSVVPVGPVDPQTRFGSVPGLNIDPADRVPLLRGLGALLSSTTRDPQGRPLGTILLPASNQVLAVNITAAPVRSTPNGEFQDLLSVRVITNLELASALQREWFSFDGVAKRVDYVGERPDQRAE
jgi:hypothetical protein